MYYVCWYEKQYFGLCIVIFENEIIADDTTPNACIGDKCVTYDLAAVFYT